ncbi:hypothetical protein PAECIP111893_03465 [Paenibacillus plantiphilus]|uniref:ABC transporter permease n=1 Tax=Paenibacillus plantiphilus TaxID=2905650 RepID=A0ABM9CGN9_9BACL|nr:hypothetical protein [Paenibacillus plantiphilus]CAH1211728.1 hypothetical protein PAECIP111893_03465 [Paenibacillus plantiphilus]
MNAPKDNEIKQLEDELRQPLSQLMVKPVSSMDTSMLIKALQPAFDTLKESAEEERFARRETIRSRHPSLLRLLRSQLSSYSRMYWLASLFVFGMLLYLLPTDNHTSYISVGDTFSFVLPALLLASLAYSFRTWNKEMRIIESITPYPPALLLIVRIMIVIGLNLVFGITGSIYMNVQVEAFPLLPFMLQWLSILLLLSGVTAYVLMWKGFKAAFSCSIILWISWLGMTQVDSPIREMADHRNWTSLQGTALAAGLLLLALAYRRTFGMKLLP